MAFSASNFRPSGLQITMILTFEIFGRARNHGRKFLKLCQTSFSGIVPCRSGTFSQSYSGNSLQTCIVWVAVIDGYAKDGGPGVV